MKNKNFIPLIIILTIIPLLYIFQNPIMFAALPDGGGGGPPPPTYITDYYYPPFTSGGAILDTDSSGAINSNVDVMNTPNFNSQNGRMNWAIALTVDTATTSFPMPGWASFDLNGELTQSVSLTAGKLYTFTSSIIIDGEIGAYDYICATGLSEFEASFKVTFRLKLQTTSTNYYYGNSVMKSYYYFDDSPPCFSDGGQYLNEDPYYWRQTDNSYTSAFSFVPAISSGSGISYYLQIFVESTGYLYAGQFSDWSVFHSMFPYTDDNINSVFKLNYFKNKYSQ